MNLNKEAFKDALYCTVWAVVTILATFALLLAISAIFKSTLWRIIVAVSIIIVVLFVYAYYQFKDKQ